MPLSLRSAASSVARRFASSMPFWFRLSSWSGQRRRGDGVAAVDERDGAAGGAEAAGEFGLHEFDLAAEDLLRAVAGDGEEVEVDAAGLSRLHGAQGLVEELALRVERGFDVGLDLLALGLVGQVAVAPDAAVLLATVGLRGGVFEGALAFVDAVGEAALVEIAVREAQLSFAVEEPVLELALVAAELARGLGDALEPAVGEGAFPGVAAVVDEATAPVEHPIAEFAFVIPAAFARVAPGSGEFAFDEIAFVHVAVPALAAALAVEFAAHESAAVAPAVVRGEFHGKGRS